MLDVSYFQNSTSNTQLFQSGGSWQTWIKPRGAKTVNFFVVGAGGGGGGGFLGSSGACSGGAGGGTGGYVKLTVQASILPDILYIIPGIGGIGGIGGSGVDSATAGGSATKSYVSLKPDISNISNIVCTSGNVVSTGGGPGNTVASTGGAGETIATSANMVFVNLGNFFATAGVSGSAGGLINGTNNGVTSFMIPGSGGGGSGTGGSNPSSTLGPFPVQTGGTTISGPKKGLIFYKPIFGLSGGVGGGGGTTGVNGGDGAPGCGGGGGGAGTTLGGNGGRGGDGFVIITTNF